MRSLTVFTAATLIVLLCTGCGPQAKKARLLKQADTYFAAGEFEKAEIEYKNALAAVPMDPQAIGRLGLVYFEQGRQMRAFSYLSKAAELQPANLEIKLKLGFMQAAGGKINEARDAALAVLAQKPQDPEAPLLLVETSVQPKQIDEARQRLQSLPAPVVNSAPVIAALGMLELRQRKLTEAEATFKRALALDPKLVAAHSALGLIYLSQKNVALADTALKAAADHSPPRSFKRIQYAQFKIQNKEAAAGRKILEDITKLAPDYIPAWLTLAQMAASDGKPDDSLGYVAKVLARESSHPEALLLSGRLRLAKGENDKAVAEMERMLGMFPQVPQVHFQLSQAYLAKGDINKATASVNQAVTLAPTFAEALVAQASLNIRKGDLAPAVTSLTKLVQQRPDILEARSMLADALRRQGKLDEALAVYEAAEKSFPRLPTTSMFRGMILAQQKKFPEARKAFERAVELAPTFVGAVEQLIILDFAEKKPDAARQHAEALIAKTTKSAEGYVLLARVMLGQKDEKMAELALQKAIAVQPESPAAYAMLARLQLSQKEPTKALANLQAIVAKNPRDGEALMLMSTIYQQQNNHAAARDTYEKLVVVNPKYAPAYNNLAYLYSEQFNQVDKAHEMAQKARELLPRDPNIADTLGWVLFQKRQYAQALDLLQESAEKLTTSAEVQYHLGMAHYMLGEEKAARAALQKAFELTPDFTGHDEARRRLAVLDIDPAKPGVDARPALEKLVAERKDDPVVLARLAALHERGGAVDKALAAYESALAASPGNISAMLSIIRLLSVRKEDARAFEMAKAARKLDAADADVAHTLGRLANQSGQNSWGLSLLQEAARKRPDVPEVLFDLAEAAFAVGKSVDAEAAMRKALELSPAFPQAARARRFLELVEAAAKPADAAAAAKVEAALKSTPNDAPALMAAAAIQEFKREAAAAGKSYEKILGLYPDLVLAKKRLAILYAPAKDADLKKTLELATKAREAYPEDAELAKALGIIVYRQGNYARAGTLLQESAAKREADAEAMYYLGMARHQLKNRTEAKKALQRALELNLAPDLATEDRKVMAELK